MSWQDEAREAVSKPWWRWSTSMLLVRPKDLDDRRECPDLTDPATVGCIRAEVERLCGEQDELTVVEWHSDGTTAAVRLWTRGGYVGLDDQINGKPYGGGLLALRALTWLHEQNEAGLSR